jgi:hypothetical protein
VNWINNVAADAALSPAARQLAGIIADKFAASANRASFFDSDATAFLNLPSGGIRKLRHELQRRGFLVELLPYNGGKPSYALRCPVSAGDGEAA